MYPPQPLPTPPPSWPILPASHLTPPHPAFVLPNIHEPIYREVAGQLKMWGCGGRSLAQPDQDNILAAACRQTQRNGKMALSAAKAACQSAWTQFDLAVEAETKKAKQDDLRWLSCKTIWEARG